MRVPADIAARLRSGRVDLHRLAVRYREIGERDAARARPAPAPEHVITLDVEALAETVMDAELPQEATPAAQRRSPLSVSWRPRGYGGGRCRRSGWCAPLRSNHRGQIV